MDQIHKLLKKLNEQLTGEASGDAPQNNDDDDARLQVWGHQMIKGLEKLQADSPELNFRDLVTDVTDYMTSDPDDSSPDEYFRKLWSKKGQELLAYGSSPHGALSDVDYKRLLAYGMVLNAFGRGLPGRPLTTGVQSGRLSVGESVGMPEGGNPEAALGEELSRKYYEALAAILRDNQTKDEIAKALVSFFKTDNSRFNPDRFMRAAVYGMEPAVQETSDEGFNAWMSKVNSEIQKTSSVDVGDIGDVPYREWYDAKVSPAQAARRAVKNAGMGEGKK